MTHSSYVNESFTFFFHVGMLINCEPQQGEQFLFKHERNPLILLAFLTGNSSLEPLLEGLFAQIHIDLS